MTRLDCRFKMPVPLGADVTLIGGLEDGRFAVLNGERVAVEGLAIG